MLSFCSQNMSGITHLSLRIVTFENLDHLLPVSRVLSTFLWLWFNGPQSIKNKQTRLFFTAVKRCRDLAKG